MASKIINILITAIFLISSSAYGCDTSTIKKVSNGYLYSKECHVWVGKNVKEIEIRDVQVKDLYKTITFKDLAIKAQQDRATLWMDTSFKVEEEYQKSRKMTEFQKWLYFGLGVVVMGAAVNGAGKLR